MYDNTYLYHHGIKGQKWGVRRFRNTDGTLTSAGKKRYLITTKEEKKELKLPKKWNYEKIDSKVDAQKAIFARAVIPSATVAVGQVAVGKYLDKQLGFNTPVSTLAKKSDNSCWYDLCVQCFVR